MELVIKQLSKTYPNGVQALKDITMTIPTGMYGLLGPNGAGKSTLMRTIATLQEADSGSITLGDLDVLKQKTDVRKILMLSLGSRTAQELERGEMDQVLIKGSNEYVLMTQAGEDAVLTVLAKSNAKLGLIFLDVKRAADSIQELI